jgi:uncharacterized Zn finger protein (UPF0148 family)
MKMKIILTVTVAAALVGGAMWTAPQRALAADSVPAGQKILYYTCPMHPSVKADKPGDCPVCGMHLVPVYASDQTNNAAPATVETNAPAIMPGCCSPGLNH